MAKIRRFLRPSHFPSSIIASFEDEPIKLSRPSSRTAIFEDELVKLPRSSSQTALFEDKVR